MKKIDKSSSFLFIKKNSHLPRKEICAVIEINLDSRPFRKEIVHGRFQSYHHSFEEGQIPESLARGMKTIDFDVFHSSFDVFEVLDR